MSDILEKHKVFRRLVLVAVLWMVYEIMGIFADNYADTGVHQTTVIVSFLGLLTLAAKFLKGDEL